MEDINLEEMNVEATDTSEPDAAPEDASPEMPEDTSPESSFEVPGDTEPIPVFQEEGTELIEGTEEPEGPSVIERIDVLLDILEAENGIQPYAEYTGIPIKGWRDWNYGITVRFEVYPYALGHSFPTTDGFAEPEDFEEWYIYQTSLIGDTIGSFTILSVWDDDGEEVYNRDTYVDPGEGPEGPGNDTPVSGEYKELLESILSGLEGIGTAGAEYRQLTGSYREEMLKLQAAETGCSIFICIALFALVTGTAFRELLGRLR